MKKYLREVNLELGKPTVRQAIGRLEREINNSRTQGVAALKVIHGYGSSGAGGKIRVEVRAYLEKQKALKKIKCYITGEKFSIFDPDTLAAFRKCDALRMDSDLERHNNGITIIILQ